MDNKLGLLCTESDRHTMPVAFYLIHLQADMT